VVSPFDAESRVYKCANNRYRCKNTGKYFNVKTATLFDNTKVEFQTGELDEISNVQKMHIANSTKPVKFYSLDAIISVGYRVNSYKATQFRIWATGILKEYMLKGFAMDHALTKN